MPLTCFDTDYTAVYTILSSKEYAVVYFFAEVGHVSTLPETIRARRKELGLTLEEVAAVVGVTPGALSHVESGRRLPDARNLISMAQALQLDPDELLTLLDEAHAERRADQVGWSRPSQRRPRASEPAPAQVDAFRAMPIDAMFAGPEESGGDRMYARANVTYSQDLSDMPLLSESRVRSNVSAASPRDRARFAPDAAERMRAAEELAEEALRAIRTLRGMLDDDDPRLAREARRLLRELDVRGVDE